ncbi:SDR family oxidoreductase [Leptolyngbya sp. AN02str]|uniref:SDR family oxidoreductase n=1 Tax=Leptolyngbya sp. AN02str TaxID=3423363 RepID=UPI003D31A136
MNITIIGCGYVGTAIARYWHQASEHQLTVTTTTTDRLEELGAIAQRSVVLQGADASALHTVLQHQEVVVVTVAPTGNQQVDADGYEQTYLGTCKNLVAVLPQVPTVRQVIYTSSCSVYGDAHGNWVDETTPITPDNRHSEILYEAEQILLSGAKAHLRPDVRICIFRMGAIYGPGRDIKHRFAKLAGTTRPGTGEHFTNWTHVDDIVAAVEFARDRQLHGIYNLVGDTPVTAHELMDRVCEQSGLPAVQWDPTVPRSRSNNRRVSNQKLQQQGYHFLHPALEI